MAIINRVGKLFTADIHALLDLLEDPQILLKQSLREMQAELEQQQKVLQQLVEQKSQIERYSEQLAREIETGKQELALCLDENNESLARSVLRRQLHAERNLAQCVKHKTEVELEITLYQRQIKDNQDNFESLRQKAELVAKQVTSQQKCSLDTCCWSTKSSVSDDDIELALMAEKRKRSMA